MGVGKIFSKGGHQWIVPKVFLGGGPEVENSFFLQFETRKTAFFAAISENASLLALKPIFVPPPTVPLH